jgi:hypothetical protein
VSLVAQIIRPAAGAARAVGRAPARTRRLVSGAERLIDPRDQEAVPRLQRHGAGLALAVARRCCRRREHGVPL